MQQIVTLVLLTLLSALAVKHVADILLYGSIFQPLRSFIARKEAESTPFFGTLNQLFTCLLCMSTQVAVWLAGLPAGLISWGYFGSFWISAFAVFMATMAVATLGMGLWTVLEYSPNRFHAKKKELEEAERKIRELTLLLKSSSAGKLGTESMFEISFARSEYFSFLETAFAKCRNIGCSIRRYYCHKDAIADFYSVWAAKNPDTIASWPEFESALYRTTHAYLGDAVFYSKSEAELTKLKNIAFTNLKSQLSFETL